MITYIYIFFFFMKDFLTVKNTKKIQNKTREVHVSSITKLESSYYFFLT